MSYEITVLPRESTEIRWGDLKLKILEYMDTESRHSWGLNPELITPDRSISESDFLEIEGDYEFLFSHQPYIFLSIHCNYTALGPSRQREMLEDYGVNLDEQEKDKLSLEWSKVGHSYRVLCGRGPTPSEIKLLIAIVSALADLCDGMVVVEEFPMIACFPGVYRPDDFKHVQLNHFYWTEES